MKFIGTILSVTALLLGFYQAPSSHIHLDDFDHPVSSTLTHSHLHGEMPVTPSPFIRPPTADDDAMDVDWNALGCSSTDIPSDFAIVEDVQLLALTLTSTLLPIPLRGGHDPPKLAPKSPRSPPV